MAEINLKAESITIAMPNGCIKITKTTAPPELLIVRETEGQPSEIVYSEILPEETS